MISRGVIQSIPSPSLIFNRAFPLMFIPFAPVTGLVLLVAFVAMNLYALYYVFDFLF